MALLERPPGDIDPISAYSTLANLGFLAHSDLPDQPGPAYLLVAIRPKPTLHHYDPERIEYWVTVDGRGARREIDRETHVPIDTAYAWGLIRIIDRLGVSNEYLTFGGRLRVERIDDAVVAVFTSPAPLLRRGGHSQGWDRCADCVGAFFGRVMLAVDYVPGFEAAFSRSGPIVRYAAFVADTIDRYARSPLLRSDHPELWTTIETERRRLRVHFADDWTDAQALLGAMASGASGSIASAFRATRL